MTSTLLVIVGGVVVSICASEHKQHEAKNMNLTEVASLFLAVSRRRGFQTRLPLRQVYSLNLSDWILLHFQR